MTDIIKKIDNELEKVHQEQEKIAALQAIQNYEGPDEVITSQEALEILAEELKKPVVKFRSGIPTLDKLLDGFREGDLVVISAPTKMGKTTLAQTFTHNFAQKEIPCLWFSYELMQKDFLQKFGEPIPFFTLPKTLTEHSLGWIKRRIIESIAKYKTKVVFLDHLHYLLNFEDISRGGNVSLLIGALMRALKGIAVKQGITVFLICHTTKLCYGKTPALEDIRDSSFISQEADTVLMMWRLKDKETDEYSDRAYLAVQANRRNGQTGKLKLVFRSGRFYEEETHLNGE